jgi:hypothetical protein
MLEGMKKLLKSKDTCVLATAPERAALFAHVLCR